MMWLLYNRVISSAKTHGRSIQKAMYYCDLLVTRKEAPRLDALALDIIGATKEFCRITPFTRRRIVSYKFASNADFIHFLFLLSINFIIGYNVFFIK